MDQLQSLSLSGSSLPQCVLNEIESMTLNIEERIKPRNVFFGSNRLPKYPNLQATVDKATEDDRRFIRDTIFQEITPAFGTHTYALVMAELFLEPNLGSNMYRSMCVSFFQENKLEKPLSRKNGSQAKRKRLQHLLTFYQPFAERGKNRSSSLKGALQVSMEVLEKMERGALTQNDASAAVKKVNVLSRKNAGDYQSRRLLSATLDLLLDDYS